jgi:Protein of unknown function (DUF5674)
MESAPGIVIVDRKLDRSELARLVDLFFGEMVKYVVDLKRRVAAVGGELHADAEQLLLESGSRQADLWGANYYPGKGRDACIEYTALINIRPAQGNRGMLIQDPEIRDRLREITFALIGEGEPLE